MSENAALALIETLAAKTMPYPFKVWGFGEGVALEALWEVDSQVPHLKGREFILGLFERWLARPVEEPDHSAPGMLLLDAYESTGDRRYLARALELAQHMTGLPCTVHDAALHRPQHPDYHDYLYVDCMEVDAPFLCKLGAVTGDSAYTDAGVQQILGYATILQDSATGLFYHQYNARTGSVNGAFWGRGSGWALLGLLKTLPFVKAHAAYGEIERRFQRLAAALVQRQLPDGGWPTVLNMPETYEESSLAPMFGAGLHLGVARGHLPPDYQAAADRAWARTVSRISDGLLEGVSVGTPPGDAPHYAQIATGSGFPWGQGPALWFAALRHEPAK